MDESVGLLTARKVVRVSSGYATKLAQNRKMSREELKILVRTELCVLQIAFEFEKLSHRRRAKMAKSPPTLVKF